MNKIKYTIFAFVAIGCLANVKAIQNSSNLGRALDYTETFGSSGLYTPRHLIEEVYLDDCPEYQFGPNYALINDYGVKKISSDGTSEYSSKHDVAVTNYIIYEKNDGSMGESNCLVNMTNTGIALTSFRLDQDGKQYDAKFVSTLVFSEGFRMYFKKSWNDTWGGTFGGNVYIFRPNSTQTNEVVDYE